MIEINKTWNEDNPFPHKYIDQNFHNFPRISLQNSKRTNAKFYSIGIWQIGDEGVELEMQ